MLFVKSGLVPLWFKNVLEETVKVINEKPYIDFSLESANENTQNVFAVNVFGIIRERYFDKVDTLLAERHMESFCSVCNRVDEWASKDKENALIDENLPNHATYYDLRQVLGYCETYPYVTDVKHELYAEVLGFSRVVSAIGQQMEILFSDAIEKAIDRVFA